MNGIVLILIIFASLLIITNTALAICAIAKFKEYDLKFQKITEILQAMTKFSQDRIHIEQAQIGVNQSITDALSNQKEALDILTKQYSNLATAYKYLEDHYSDIYEQFSNCKDKLEEIHNCVRPITVKLAETIENPEEVA